MSKRLMIPVVVVVVAALAVGIVFTLKHCAGDTDFMNVDPDTGLHITGIPTEVDITTYRLKVSGKVDHELSLSYDEILALPKVTGSPDLVCPGWFVDKATWSGVTFKAILDMAGVQADAAWVRMESADGYSIKAELEVALAADSFLAYELDGKQLPFKQGFPLRAVFPDREGSLWVKWIVELVVE